MKRTDEQIRAMLVEHGPLEEFREYNGAVIRVNKEGVSALLIEDADDANAVAGYLVRMGQTLRELPSVGDFTIRPID